MLVGVWIFNHLCPCLIGNLNSGFWQLYNVGEAEVDKDPHYNKLSAVRAEGFFLFDIYNNIFTPSCNNNKLLLAKNYISIFLNYFTHDFN